MRDSADIEFGKKILKDGESYLQTVAGQAAWKFGDMWFFDEDEYNAVSDVKTVISNYVHSENRKRPLCIAVFGPPGSGKSFAVRQIQKAIQEEYDGKYHFPFSEINMTQISTQRDLYLSFKEVKSAVNAFSTFSGPKPVPFVFVDEFDVAYQGVSLGWLNWFLAPMQDGHVGHGDEKFELSDAIYFFAGGTAPAMDSFFRPGTREFVNAKGPDFVSRLRGHIDISGPNHDQRTCARRALIMRHSILEKNGTADLEISEDLVSAFFAEGRFKHGARSISVLLDMAKSVAEHESSDVICREHLPSPHIQAIHADQGPLSSASIGGLIGVSVGQNIQEDDDSFGAQIAKSIIGGLWQYGATISYGGKWDRALTDKIIEDSSLDGIAPAIEPERVEVFAREDKPGAVEYPGVKVVPVRTYLRNLGAGDDQDRLRASLAAFRMRWMLSCRSVARVLIGGKLTDYSGRMPGVIEEAVLALYFQQPIFVIGAGGGASKVVGELLGLATSERHGAEHIQEDDLVMDPAPEIVTENNGLFRASDGTDLPMSPAEATSFIARHAFGGPLWPDNGLSLSENRLLFSTDNPREISELVLRGLITRFN